MSVLDMFKVKQFKVQIAQLEKHLHDAQTLLDMRSVEKNSLLNELDLAKREAARVDEELNEIKSIITPDVKEAMDINRHISQLRRQSAEQEAIIGQRMATISKVENQIKELKCQVIELNETRLLQDFSLYEPVYDFASSSEYKSELKRNLDAQKQMIKDKTAATCTTEWTVDGSRAAGLKMTKDNIKQMLMTFNTECENAIANVRFNNFDSMKARIIRLFEKLNQLGKSSHINISMDYCELKVQELTIAYEYAQKQQKEKEEIRERRAIQRENLKVQKELEEQRRKLEKEQSHYNNIMRQLREQFDAEKNFARKELIGEKINAVSDELINIYKALADVDYRQANERAGYVYVISNIGAFGEGVYKIGMTRRLEPLDRIDELGGASVPFRFDVHAIIFSDDAPKLETALHNAFADKRVNMINSRKEFFRVSLKDIEAVVQANHDKTVEFDYTTIAEQYRESVKMAGMRKNQNANTKK